MLLGSSRGYQGHFREFKEISGAFQKDQRTQGYFKGSLRGWISRGFQGVSESVSEGPEKRALGDSGGLRCV